MYLIDNILCILNINDSWNGLLFSGGMDALLTQQVVVTTEVMVAWFTEGVVVLKIG